MPRHRGAAKYPAGRTRLSIGKGQQAGASAVDERVDELLGFVVKRSPISTNARDDPAAGP